MPLDLLLKCQVITYLIASICVKYEKLALPCKFLTGYYWIQGGFRYLLLLDKLYL